MAVLHEVNGNHFDLTGVNVVTSLCQSNQEGDYVFWVDGARIDLQKKGGKKAHRDLIKHWKKAKGVKE